MHRIEKTKKKRKTVDEFNSLAILCNEKKLLDEIDIDIIVIDFS